MAEHTRSARYNPVILANLITGLIFSAGNVAVLLAPVDLAVKVAVLAVADSAGLLLAFLVTGALAQSRTTPIDPGTGEPLNPDYALRSTSPSDGA